ncbi:response regulator [Sphingobacterium spiritivorum]|uniref:response regulator n=1 Tax=Sphingobacterium spiritivorum TaxID=258 RepID=UPI00191A3A86|nr:response regulator [Sphingobacterium spiritivorum]QQT26124.1 response regulator [Sphingobacterium spiritivorum]
MEKDKLILIIDDDSRNIFALTLTLKSKGYRSVSSQSAAEGIALLEENKNIGVVLLDMMMPEMDGYEAMKIIRGLEQYKHIPVIAVTAQAMDGDREKCIEAGAWDYISKPIDVDKLLAVIGKVK